MRAKFTFELYRGKGATRLRVRHRNGNIVFNAGQGYSRSIDAEKMLANFIEAIKAGDYDNLDKIHGRTTTKIPDDSAFDPSRETDDYPDGENL